MAKYFSAAGHVIDKETDAFIPKDAGNREYSQFLAWCAAGNTPDTEPPAELLARARAAALRRVKESGFVRVHREFPPHMQARLAFKPANDATRMACRDLIEAAKTAVDSTEAAIMAASTPAEIEAATAALNLPA